jgi:hypothetical protein
MVQCSCISSIVSSEPAEGFSWNQHCSHVIGRDSGASYGKSWNCVALVCIIDKNMQVLRLWFFLECKEKMPAARNLYFTFDLKAGTYEVSMRNIA